MISFTKAQTSPRATLTRTADALEAAEAAIQSHLKGLREKHPQLLRLPPDRAAAAWKGLLAGDKRLLSLQADARTARRKLDDAKARLRRVAANGGAF